MSKEHIFVIKYTNEKGWEWDTDLEERFDDGTIYDTETNEWIPAHVGQGEYVDNDDDIGENLGKWLRMANEVEGK
jgi:hypothetical protein